jgi:putative ABC transport system substrate-binding protein
MPLLRRIAVLFCTLLVVCTGYCANVVVVASERSASYVAASDALSAELGRLGPARTTVANWNVAEVASPEPGALADTKVIVALGTLALKAVLAQDPKVPVVAALIPRSGVERILKELGHKPTAPVVAVYLDQPFSRQVELIRLALPEARRVGVLWGPESALQRPALAAALQARALQEVGGAVVAGEPLHGALKSVLEETDVLLAVADATVFNSSTVSNLLVATYRARIPVLAFSPAYVKAGAMLALYSTPAQIGAQAATMVRLVLQGGATAVSQYPADFSVVVNEHVARSLGLGLDAGLLQGQLRQLEKRP